MSDKIYELFEKLSRGVQAANSALMDIGLNLTGQEIDEVALLFGNEIQAWKFINYAVQVPGVKLFNVASDTVQTYPIRSKYGVEYYFLETTWGYRVECMILAGGHSPLHGGVKQTYFDVVGNQLDSGIVHYSWKCTDEAEYEDACKAMEVGKWHRAMTCHSMYGTFSYWMTGEDTDGRLAENGVDWCLSDNPLEAYIKPRVNLRDSVDIRPEVVAERNDLEVSQAAQDYLGSKA